MKNAVVRNVIFFVLALFLFQKDAKAQFLTGADLLAHCQSDEGKRVYSCMNYVAGVIDYHVVMQSLGTAPTTSFCLPAKVGIEEATVVVMAYLKKSPHHLAFIAAPAVTMALAENWPCEKPKPKKKKKK